MSKSMGKRKRLVAMFLTYGKISQLGKHSLRNEKNIVKKLN
jgi:hypothetical protein